MARRAKKAKKPRKQGSSKPKKLPISKQNKPRETQAARIVSRAVVAVPSTTRDPQLPNKTATRPAGKILVDRIDGETVLGDLIVAFPWTREVLRKYGLRLEVEEAGDIYMSLEAFAALRNLEPNSLVRELVESSKQPPQPPQAVPPLVTAPTV